MFSLTPAVHDVMDELRRPFSHDLYDQHFGVGLDEVLHPRNSLFHVPLRSGYLRPWRHVAPAHSGISNVHYDKEGFKVNLDVQQFKPEELKVKVVDDYLVVEAKHDERTDHHGYISRSFTRRYKLPQDIDPQAVVSNLSSDGVLSLHAPKKALPDSNVREIPITHTNAPALKMNGEHPKEVKKANAEKMDDN